MCKKVTHQHPQHTVCAGVSGVTKDAGTARCAVVSSQWTGDAVREGEVLFSVFSFIPLLSTVHNDRENGTHSVYKRWSSVRRLIGVGCPRSETEFYVGNRFFAFVPVA
jgi:hypothetical protein